MDFKVAGTREFVTAIQLDTKLDGIPADVLAGALTQARDARLHILDVMNEAIDAPDEMSPFAPRVIAVTVPVDKIGEVIGPKGKMINQIQDETGAQISIEDDGTVYIGATDGPSAEAARAMINAIANPQMPEIGERFLGTVVKTTTFGAFISLLPGKDGLLHISEVRKLVGGKRIDNVDDVLAVGQKVQVELKEIDPRGKLSLAAVLAEGETGDEQAPAADSAPAAAPAADVDAERGRRRHRRGRRPGRDGEHEERGERRPRNRRRGGNRGRGERSDVRGRVRPTPDRAEPCEGPHREVRALAARRAAARADTRPRRADGAPLREATPPLIGRRGTRRARRGPHQGLRSGPGPRRADPRRSARAPPAWSAPTARASPRSSRSCSAWSRRPAGAREVLGHDIATEGEAIRAAVGYLPEHDCLPPDVSASDFVVHLAMMSGLPRVAARERAAEVLRHVGLAEERYRPMGGYSTGMKQKAKLAQALAHDPRLVLLDEPTNGLDPAARDEMLGLVQRIGRDFGIAVIVTSPPARRARAGERPRRRPRRRPAAAGLAHRRVPRRHRGPARRGARRRRAGPDGRAPSPAPGVTSDPRAAPCSPSTPPTAARTSTT